MRLAAALASALAAGLAAAACAPVDALNAITPGEGARRIADLRYAEGPRGMLDLYLPPGGARADAPLLVFFYGGGWRSGAKEDYRFLGSAFAARGWIVAIPDYRLAPEVRWPAFAEDGAAAVAALPRLLAAEGIVPSRGVVLAGHSAGAHTAAMLALEARWLAAHGLSPCRDVAALLGLAGPYAIFPTGARTVVAAFGPAPQPGEVSPLAHVSAAAPPAVLIAGSADALVSPRNSEALAEALSRAGRPAELRVLDGAGHIDIVAAIAAPLRHTAPTLEAADAGLRAALAAPPRACS
jgi:acetyl esterase/lipase